MREKESKTCLALSKILFACFLLFVLSGIFNSVQAQANWCGQLFTKPSPPNPPDESPQGPPYNESNPPNVPSKCPPCEGCPDLCKKSPSYVGAGNYSFSVADLSLPTRGASISVSRDYDSARPVDGIFGIGWSSNVNTSVFYTAYLFSAPSTYIKEATVRMPSGATYRFAENVNGTFTPPNGSYETLIRNADGTFDLTPGHSRMLYRYNSSGSLISFIDEFQNVVNYSYDGNGRLMQIADGTGSGRYINVFYGGDGRVSYLQDSAGRVVEYFYDPQGKLTRFNDAVDRDTKYFYTTVRFGPLLTQIKDHWDRVITDVTYDTVGRISSYTEGGEKYTYVHKYNNDLRKTSKTNLAGNMWVYTFNDDGLVTRIDPPSGQGAGVETNTFYPNGKVDLYTDGFNVTTKYTYNGNGTVATITRGSSAIRFDYTYDSNFPEKVVAIVPKNPANGVRNADWQEWRYDYHQPGSTAPGALHHVYRVRTDGFTLDTLSTYVYNSAGQVSTVTDAAGAVTTYNYDPATGDLLSVTYPSNSDSGPNPVYAYGRDALGRVISNTDPLNKITSYTYDAVGRITSVTIPKPTAGFPLDFITTYTYDNYDAANGTVYTTQTDPNLRLTTQWFDQFGQMLKSRDALNKDTLFSYNKGLLASITDANGNVTSYTYNGLRQLVTTTFPEGPTVTETYTYRTDGLLKTKKDRKNQTITYAWDTLKRFSSRAFPGGLGIGHTYTGEKLTSAYNQVLNETHTYTFDSSYRVASEVQPGRGTVSYLYDAADRVTRYTVSGGGPVTDYTYYSDGSMRTIAWSPVAGSFTYAYTLNGQHDTITFPNSQVRDFTHDDQGRLTQIANTHPVVGNLATYSYGYDVDNYTSQSTMLGQRSSLTADVPSQNFINSTTHYFYDGNYQLKQATYPNVAPFNAEIDSWQYDDIGNRTQQTVNAVPTNYTYFPLGNPPHNSQRLQNDGVKSYTYDANGSTLTAGTTPYVWNYDNEMTQNNGSPWATHKYDYRSRRCNKTTAAGTYSYVYDGENLIGVRGLSTEDYLFGPGIDEPLALKIGTNIYYYSVDALGSVTLVTNSLGLVQNSYVYDVWGVVRGQTAAIANQFGYTAREFAEGGIQFYRARYYNPNIGRFVGEDPTQIALEFYLYANNSPTDSIDPLGLYTVVDQIGMTPHSTVEKLDKACFPYITAGECAGVDGALSWTCTCVGGFLYKLDTTITLSGNINYFDGKLPIRPAFDKMFKFGTAKDAAKRHVTTYHVKIALGSLEPLIRAYEAIPYFGYLRCNTVGILLSSKYSDYFNEELKRTKEEESKQRRPKIRVRTTW